MKSICELSLAFIATKIVAALPEEDSLDNFHSGFCPALWCSCLVFLQLVTKVGVQGFLESHSRRNRPLWHTYEEIGLWQIPLVIAFIRCD